MSFDLIKLVVVAEYKILIVLIIVASIASIIFEIYHRRKKRFILFVEENLYRMITQKIDIVQEYFPNKVMYLKYILPCIQKFDALFKDPFWDYLKRQILGKYLAKEVYYHLYSFHWGRSNIAIQAIRFLPLPKYEDEVLKYLHTKKKDIIRFSAADCAMRYNTKKSIRALVDALSEEPYRTQFPFRDPLVYSAESTHSIINEYYRETTNIKVKIACLKILSLKVGYLSIEDAKEYLSSDNLELRFWSIRALENLPSPETTELLLKLYNDKHWIIRSLVAYIYGAFKITTSIDNLVELLYDEHYYVSFMAALCLNYFGDEGKKILASPPKIDERVFKNCQYILSLPETSFEKGLQKFFPINQDPLTIIEAIL
ncbi:hypothetical protein COB11_05275 [Candidatus Aerophobetes bacterium]|uniref:HEAT repeat domain-containing protein n=1 Tax=Aerophobetes bacterium TaxID=2030807 RepID=A0A2A4YGK4_UNCAE|nr:MAG: hypothetical protein COB11_05275 [Candidatus Aerophobetes bacterium]